MKLYPEIPDSGRPVVTITDPLSAETLVIVSNLASQEAVEGIAACVVTNEDGHQFEARYAVRFTARESHFRLRAEAPWPGEYAWYWRDIRVTAIAVQ